MADAPQETGSLPRRIGLWSAVAIVIGSTIGSGIFRSPAGIADRLPGPLPLLSIWVMGGIFALCGALSLAEIASAIPRTGGLYAFLRDGWGRLPAFLFGWTQFTLIRASALGGISITFAQYAMRSAGYDPSVAPYDQYARYLAAVAVIVAAWFNIRGVKWGSAVTNVTTIAKFGGLMFIVILALAIGLPQSGGANFTPAVPPGSFAIAPFGLALVSVLWAFDGWGDLSFVAGEVKDPQRNLPRALIGGTLAVLAIYLAANVGYLSVLSVEEIRRSPLVAADTAQRLVGDWGVAFVGLTVMVSTFGTLNAVLLTSPRIFFAAADDGLFFRQVAAVHPTYKTPWVAIGLTAALAVGFVLLRTFEQLADTFVTAIIPFYALAIASIYVLRRQRGYAPSFRVPGYPLIPALFILSTIFILANAVISPASRWPTLAVMGVILLGIPVYFATVGRRTPAREGA